MDISKIISNPIIVGLAVGAAAYWFVEFQKPSIIYNKDSGALQNDLISPLTIGAAVALGMGMYMNSRDSSSGLMSASEFASKL